MILKKHYRTIYKHCKQSWMGIIFSDFCKYLISRDYFHRKLHIKNQGSLRIKKWVVGKDNKLMVGKGTCLNNVTIKIQGSHNLIKIDENVFIGKNCKLYLFGNNLELTIGKGCTFSHDDELLVQENNSKIHIGDGCMFSHHINVRTSDAHPIYYCETKQRSNIAKNVYIGNHVWVGANVIIQKGSHIGDGCVVATYSVVNHKILSDNRVQRDGGKGFTEVQNSIIAGIPAKIVKKGIYWEKKFS